MSVRCSICKSPNADAVNEALLDRVPFRRLAERYGTSKAALSRHRSNCLPKYVRTGAAAQEIVLAEKVLDQVQSLTRKTLGILERAEASNDDRLALLAVKEARASMELIAKLTGEFDQVDEQELRPMFILEGDAQVTVNIETSRDERVIDVTPEA